MKSLKKILQAVDTNQETNMNQQRVDPVIVHPPSPVTRQRSARAAQAAQELEEMETAIEQLRAELTAANARIILVEGANVRLHEEIDRTSAEHAAKLEVLERERDHYKEENITVQANLDTCANILLGLKRRPGLDDKPAVSEYAPRPKTADDRAEEIGRKFAAQGDIADNDTARAEQEQFNADVAAGRRI